MIYTLNRYNILDFFVNYEYVIIPQMELRFSRAKASTIQMYLYYGLILFQ